MPARHHLHIEALHLDLHGIDPATAQAAIQLLGPALSEALRDTTATTTANLNAGTLQAHGSPQQLATAIAQRLAGSLQGEQP